MSATVRPTISTMQHHLTICTTDEHGYEVVLATIPPDERDGSPNVTIAATMAASFEMLEALQALDLKCRHAYPDLLRCPQCKARAALTKALGQTS